MPYYKRCKENILTVSLVTILNIFSMHESLKPQKHLRLILAFTSYITHALTLSPLLGILGIIVYPWDNPINT